MKLFNKLIMFILGMHFINIFCLNARNGSSDFVEVDDFLSYYNTEKNADCVDIKNHLIYRYATLKDSKDLDAIDDIYAKMDHEDTKKLVYVPAPFRRDFIAESIHKRRLFVAENNGKIVGFIKIFIVDNYHTASDNCFTEFHNIAHNELCFLGDARELIQHGVYHVSAEEVNNSSKRLLFTEQSGEFIKKSNQVYLYYGCSYVVPEYRGNGIGTQLDRVAFESLKIKILLYIAMHKLSHIDLVFLYGQVEDNANKQLPLRSFARFIHSLKSKKSFDHADFSFWAYRASKPIFSSNLRTGELDRIEVPRDRWSDFGCVVSCSLDVASEVYA